MLTRLGRISGNEFLGDECEGRYWASLFEGDEQLADAGGERLDVESHGRQGGSRVAPPVETAEADEGDIVRDAQPVVDGGSHAAERQLVAGGEDGADLDVRFERAADG